MDRYRPGPIILIVTTLLWATVYLSGLALPLQVGQPGTVDFVQYWAGFHLLMTGRNPYDGAVMHTLQSAVGQSAAYTTLMWNPPWTPLLLAPFTTLPFGTAVIGWLSASILCLVAVAVIAPRALGYPRLPPLIAGVATVAFYPAADGLILGQLAAPLTLIFVCALVCVDTGRYRTAGALAALLTVKPHLFFLFIPPALAWLAAAPAITRRRCLAGFIGTIGGLLGLTLAACPSALGWWLDSFGATPTGPGATAVREWQTATIATALRRLSQSLTGAVPTWPVVVVPLTGFVLVAVATYRSTQPIRWARLAPPLLCLSLGLNPYGWLYDQTLLILCQIALAAEAWNTGSPRRRYGIVFGLSAIQLTIALIGAQPWSAQHHFFWVPWTLLALWYGAGNARLTTAPGAS